MTAEHDDLVFFIRTDDLANDVVAGLSFGNDVALEVEFQFDGRSVSQKTGDAAKISRP